VNLGSDCLQMSYWRQFEQGMLSKEATRKLQECTEVAADHKGKYVTIEHLFTIFV